MNKWRHYACPVAANSLVGRQTYKLSQLYACNNNNDDDGDHLVSISFVAITMIGVLHLLFLTS